MAELALVTPRDELARHDLLTLEQRVTDIEARLHLVDGTINALALNARPKGLQRFLAMPGVLALVISLALAAAGFLVRNVLTIRDTQVQIQLDRASLRTAHGNDERLAVQVDALCDALSHVVPDRNIQCPRTMVLPFEPTPERMEP